MNLNGTRAAGEFGITILNPQLWRLKYALTTTGGGGCSVTPTGQFIVGSTEFQKADAKTADAKPIQIDWTYGPMHRVEFTCLRLGQGNFWLNPAFVGQWVNLSITATGEKDGKQISDSERINSFYPSAGIEACYDLGNARTTILATASDKYLRVRAGYSWAVSFNLNFGVGWQAEQMKMERETTVRSQGVYGQIGARF